ncbi:MAG: FAD-dependent oxidoreductase [Jatrophihabitans sp.]|uniref:FAD-dependent oxidoreductase n=1 Tax=Jatrophihabitans sp. TaxID=1932789 RepID=UPI003F81A193
MGEQRGRVVNTVVMSGVSCDYAPSGRQLVSASTLGADASAAAEQAVRRHLDRLWQTDTSRWELVGAYPLPHALPDFAAGTPLRRPVSTGPDGVIVCGDHRDTPSQQGALVSGNRAAAAALARLA